MTFLHPEFLYFMLPVVLILFYFLITQKDHQARFFSEEVMEKLRVNGKHLSLKARNALFMLATIFFLIALAQPVVKEGKIKVEAKSSDVMIALDISDSMLAEDAFPNRLEKAKKKILDYIKLAPKERIGVIAFAKEAYLVAPLSFDHRAVRFLVDRLQPGSMTEKGTDFVRLLHSSDELLKDQAQRYLLIFTDGGDQRTFDEEIEYAKAHNIKVFVLGFGTDKGAPIKNKDGEFIKKDGTIIVSKHNEDVSELAIQTGGAYIKATKSKKDIKAMLQEIAHKTEKKSLKSEEIEKFEQLFIFPLACGMVVLLLALSSMSRREKVKLPLALFFTIFLFNTPSAHAFIYSDDENAVTAKEAYEKGEYKKSASLYKQVNKQRRDNASLYNEANALYKDKEYGQAASLYKKIKSDDPEMAFDATYNLGNSYAKQGTLETLKQAVEAYEAALKIKEDLHAQENLEKVKEAIKQLEEKKKQQEQQNDQKNKQDQKNQNQQGDKQDKTQQNQQQKNQKQQQQDNQKQSDNNDNNKQQQKTNEQKESSENKKQKSASQSKEEKQKAEQEKQEQMKKADKNQKQMDEQQRGSAAEMSQEHGMSDREEKKWLKLLNKNNNAYIYKLQPNEQQQEREYNENPW